MDAIQHKYIEINGLKLHVAEIGSDQSPAVVFLHGFPEIWYSWRHQMVAVANAGFRAVAYDHRGYGLSDPPSEPEKTTFSDLVADLLALLNALSISKAFLIGSDFGAMVASIFADLHQERLIGFVTLGVPFYRPQFLTPNVPQGFYGARWQEPGRAQSDFGRFDAKTVVKNVYILFSKSEIPIARENQEIMDLVDSSTPLPSWLTEEDFATYGSLYEKSGFRTALQVPYRSFHEKIDTPDVKVKVEVPALLIMGENDYTMRFEEIADYITSGKVKTFVPNLEINFIPEGTHFVQEQLPARVNHLLINFLKSHSN